MQASSKSVVDILSATRNLLSDPKAWIKGAYANRDDAWITGAPAWANPNAHCWCLSGAAQRSGAKLLPKQDEPDAFGFIERAIGEGALIPEFNDDPSTTHADVLAVLDRAIELAKAEEGKPA